MYLDNSELVSLGLMLLNDLIKLELVYWQDSISNLSHTDEKVKKIFRCFDRNELECEKIFDEVIKNSTVLMDC